jgi:Protein of unknown function (DUF1501)
MGSFTRRQLLQCSLGAFVFPPALSAMGASRKAGGTTATPPRARGVIHILLEGGMSHLETWDPKPNAPAETRGEFQTIATSLPGLRIGEHMPQLARQAHVYNLIRSMHCDARNDHSPGMHLMLTGWENVAAGVAMERLNLGHPAVGAVIAHQLGVVGPGGAPRSVSLPHRRQIDGAVAYTGSAFLGPSCEAFETGQAPAAAGQPMQTPPSLALAGDIPLRRLHDRDDLRQSFNRLHEALDRDPVVGRLDAHYQRALSALGSQRMRAAFDLQAEPLPLRERYGDNRVGQSLLLARRLIEAGVAYVLVDPYGSMVWDTHANNFTSLKQHLPPLDQAVSALLDDLDQRGRLDEVLVLLTTEMGRTPAVNAARGRDHWTSVFSLMLAGGGLTRGQVLGSSTSGGQYPGSRPVTVPEVFATVYHLLGIDPSALLVDEQKRPIPILPEARPIQELVS